MTLGTLVQIIIALIFIYLISSLVVSELQEQFAALLEFRAKNLRQAIDIFIGKAMRDLLYKNSLASFNQYTNSMTGTSAGPSYIEPKVFAESLLVQINNLLEQNNKLSKNETLEEVIGKLQTIKTKYPETIKRLTELADSTKLKHDNPTLDQFIDEIALTFNQVMERTSGVYKRNAKGVSLVFGFLVAACLNIDSFHIINQLYKNPALRQQINQVSTKVIENSGSCLQNAKDNQVEKQKCIDKAMDDAKKLEGLSQPLPIGWNEKGWFNGEQIKAQNGLFQVRSPIL